MQDFTSSSPPPLYPSTPSRSRPQYTFYTHPPLNSSPLASPKSSPVSAAQARRRSQYKSRTPSGPRISRNLDFSGARSSDGAVLPDGESSQTFLRERFRARCFERANKARERAIKGKRGIGRDGSSDGFDETMSCDDEEESDDTVMQDELFRRIMENANRKNRHQYRLSYAHEVGSSVDPDMEDVSLWERELREFNSEEPHTSPPGLTPQNLEEEELAAYAEEYAACADFGDLEGLVDEIFDLSDVGDPSTEPATSRDKGKQKAGDVDMIG